METKNFPQLTILSGACCSPNLIRQDQALEKILRQALSELELPLEVQKESLSHVLHDGGNLNPKQQQRITRLFQSYNTRFTPALLVGDEVKFAGKIPSVEQIKEILKGYQTP